MDSSFSFLGKLNDVSAIEGRLILLKRQAAESEKLRSERDLLLSKLKNFSKVNIEQLHKDNDDLLKKNYILITKLKDFEYKRACKEINEASELALLKNELEAMKTSEKERLTKIIAERNALVKENKELNEKVNLESLMPSCKEKLSANHLQDQLTKQFYIIKRLREENVKLQNELNEKDIKIDVMVGKITHLQSQLKLPRSEFNSKMLEAHIKNV